MDERTIPVDWVDYSVWHPMWEREVEAILADGSAILSHAPADENYANTIYNHAASTGLREISATSII